jgi:hypothetical protein
MGDELDNLPVSGNAAAVPIATPAEEMKPVTEPSTDTGGGGKKRSDFASVVFGGFFYLVIGLVWVWNSSQAQNFLLRNRWPLGVITALALVAMGIAWVRRDMIEATANRNP